MSKSYSILSKQNDDNKVNSYTSNPYHTWLQTHPIAKIIKVVQIPFQLQLLQQPLIGAGQQLIENVEVPFATALMDDTRLLQQIVKNVATFRSAGKVKLNVHVLAETRRIVVAIGLGIAESFQHRIGLQQFVLDTFYGRNVAGRCSYVLQHLLGGLGFSGSTFAWFN